MSLDRERLARVLLSVVKAGGDWQAGAEAVVADIAAQGYAIVPVEPTEAMKTATDQIPGHWDDHRPEDVWQAMLTAAQGEGG